MPKYRITSPDGVKYEITAPEGATQEQVLAYAQSQHKPESPAATQEKTTLMQDVMSGIGHYVADKANTGFGAIRGAGSIGATLAAPYDYGMDYIEKKNPNIADLIMGNNGKKLNRNEQRRADIDSGLASLGADTKSDNYAGGKVAAEILGTADVGGVLGAGAEALKMQKLANALRSTGFSLGDKGGNRLVNGATRVAGASGTGGVSAGLVNPEDAGVGAGITAVIPVLGKTAGAVAETAGKAIAPLTEKGNNKILADLLMSKTGSNTDDVISALEQARGNTTGFNPTVGQSSGNADLATLERVFSERNPGQFQGVRDSQTQALANAVRGLGGDDVARNAALQARTDATEGLYNQAQNANVELTPELQSLLQRPSMQDAASRAQKLALERNEQGIIQNAIPDKTIDSNIIGLSGLPLTSQVIEGKPAQMQGKNAQYLKMGLDDMINSAPQTGLTGNELRAVQGTKADYLGELEKQIPQYLQANNAFRELSKPINQMDLGNEIANKYIPAIYRDVPIPNQLNHDQLAKALYDNGDKMAQSVTGFKGATLKNTLSPQQLATLQNAVKDSQYIKNGQLRGKPVNSSTFQNLAFNSELENGGILPDVIKNLLPLSVAGNVAKAGRDFIYKGANENLTEKLADALLNPQKAAQLLKTRSNQLTKQQQMALLLSRPELAQSAGVLSAQ